MKTETPLEQRLRTYLDWRASEPAPVALEDRIVRHVAEGPNRASVPVSWTRQLIAAAAVVALAVGVAVTLYVRHHEPARPKPTPTPPALSSSGALIPPFVRFFTAQAAWVGTDGDLRVTSDGGQHWQVRLTLRADQSFYSVRLLDAAHVVAVAVTGSGSRPGALDVGTFDLAGHPATLYATSDAGQHWQVTRFGPIGSPEPMPCRSTQGRCAWDNVYFVDAHEGWRLVRIFRTISDDLPQTFVLYHTVDSGAHWSAVAGLDPSQPQVSGNGLQLKPAPQGVIFTDSTRGMLGVFSTDGAARLYVTQDGGRNWRLTQLPPPPGFISWVAFEKATWKSKPGGQALPCCTGLSTFVQEPTMFGRAGVLMEAGFFYTTTDGGMTWANPRPEPPADGFVFLDPDHWLGMSLAGPCCPGSPGNFLYQTADAGMSWQRLPFNPPAGTGYPGIVSAGQGVIWAIAGRSPSGRALWPVPGCDSAGQLGTSASCELVIRSSDGGAHWTVVSGFIYTPPVALRF